MCSFPHGLVASAVCSFLDIPPLASDTNVCVWSLGDGVLGTKLELAR